MNRERVLRVHSIVSLLLLAGVFGNPKTDLFLFTGWCAVWYAFLLLKIFPGELRRTASKLTLLRFVLAGGATVLGVTLLRGRPALPLVLFIAAELTDLFDGIAARRTGPSDGGAFLDGETDAVFIALLCLYLSAAGLTPPAVCICAALRFIFFFPFSRTGVLTDPPKRFIIFAKAACAAAAVLLISAAAPFWEERLFLWLPAAGLLGISFLWELRLRARRLKITMPKRCGAIIVSAALSLAVLAAGLGAYRWIPRGNWPFIFAPTLETAFLVLFILLLRQRKGRAARIYTVLLSAAAGLFLFYSFIEAFTRRTFSQPFDPWSDIAYFAPLIEMVFHRDVSTVLLFSLVLSLAAVFVAAGFLLLRRLKAFGRCFRQTALLLPALLLCAAFLTAGANPLYARMAEQLTPPETESYLAEAMAYGTAAETELPDAELPSTSAEAESYRLPGFRDANIIVLIVESYGNTVFTNTEHFSRMEETYARLGKTLRTEGIHTSSALIESPIAGGRSWLADATLLSGISLTGQALFDALMKKRPYTLVHFFKDAGYYTVFAAPGTTYLFDDWTEVFPFDRFLIRGDFGYKGPFLSFGAMPDQYLLECVHRFLDEGKPAGGKPAGKEAAETVAQPVFFEALLSTSHTPFDVVPAYVEDWSMLGDGSIYGELESRFYDNGWLGGSEYPEGYTDSMKYVLNSITDFAVNYLSTSDILLVLGDHQPRYPVLERNAGWEVPFHVLAKDKELLRSWYKAGLVPGLFPDQSGPVYGMEGFFPLVKEISGVPSGESRAQVIPGAGE